MATARQESALKEYRDKIKYHHSVKDYVVFTDGSANNMTKIEPVSSFAIYKNGELVHTYAETFGLPTFERTNNVAECLGVYLAAKWIVENNLQYQKITFFSDSRFTVDWLMKLSWTPSMQTMPYCNSLNKMRVYLKQIKSFERHWIPRELNDFADSLTRIKKPVKTKIEKTSTITVLGPMLNLSFNPKEDITAFELAHCMPYIFIDMHPASLLDLSQTFFRHFKIN